MQWPLISRNAPQRNVPAPMQWAEPIAGPAWGLRDALAQMVTMPKNLETPWTSECLALFTSTRAARLTWKAPMEWHAAITTALTKLTKLLLFVLRILEKAFAHTCPLLGGVERRAG